MNRAMLSPRTQCRLPRFGPVLVALGLHAQCLLGTVPDAAHEARIADLLSRLTLEEKAVQLASSYPNGNARLGIPQLVAGEALHGVCLPEATCFPQAIGLAATWDTTLMEDTAAIIAREARALGMHQTFSPMLGLARDPRWGRVEESFGEDPWLVARLGVAYVRGMQGTGAARFGPDKLLCTPKHFVADGESLRGGNGEAVEISEATLRETALLPFEAVIREAGAGALMPAHHALNRIPCHANRWLLTDVLRREWGFDGLVVSDNGDLTKLFHWDVASGHYLFDNYEEAGARALAAGVDSELCFATPWSSPRRTFGAQLAAAVTAGRIPMADLDRAVSNVLRAKLRLGLFEDPLALPSADVKPASAPDAATGSTDFDPWAEAIRKGIFDGLTPAPRPDWRSIVRDPAHEKAALLAAEKSLVLLKNEGALLPLEVSRLRKIAVLGPNADARVPGGYSGRPRYFVSVLEGIRRFVGDSIAVTHAPGCGLTASEQDDIPAAVALAREADLAIVVVGTSRATMGENLDRAVLELTGRQEELVQAVHATGKPVVVVLIHGGALAIPWIAKNVPAIVSAWYAGQETGTAVARALFGAVNPGGKLPLTFPSATGMVPCYYNALPPAGPQRYLEGTYRVTYPFGHGLSYTTFKLGAPRLAFPRMPADNVNSLTVQVSNTGSRDGDAVVQLYVRRRFAATVRPPRELKGFVRLSLAAGETREVVLPVGFEQLKTWVGGRWQIEPGEFVLQVGQDSVTGQDVRLTVP